MARTAEEKFEGLSKERTRLLELLLEAESRKSQAIKRFPRDTRVEPVRVTASWAQQRLWFVDQLEGGSTAYNIPLAVRLRGRLLEDALQAALDALVQRHEVLRTVFVSVEGKPQQEIAAQGRFALQVIDLGGLEPAVREGQIRSQQLEESHTKFDLRHGPLIRGRLIRVQPGEHVLLITMHHIISDGWSLQVLFSELAALYEARCTGRSELLKPLPIQYGDFAQWQQQWLQGESARRQMSYWREQMRGVSPQLELPTDRPRPSVQSYRGGRANVTLDAPLTSALNAFSRRHDMTLFMVLYAGWAILLSRLSGQDDIVIGTPIANRQRPELERLIGIFANTLVLRVHVGGDLAVKELLKRVREVTTGAYDHQDTPFEQVVEAVQPERSLSRNPLFQVALALQNAPQSSLQLSGLTTSPQPGLSEPAMFDLLLSLEEREERIEGIVYYAADLFDHSTIERWMASFEVLLRGMIEETDRKVEDLPILPPEQLRQVLHEFNADALTCQEQLINSLFEAQVERTPNAIAVTHEGRSLTYADLNARANRLGHLLIERGIGPDSLVGICVERGLEMVVGLLGILKAGGAYVPLDPTYPADRLAHMLEDAAPRVLITQTSLTRTLGASASHFIFLDADSAEIDKQPAHNPNARTSDLKPNHLAYVIYTSGSTGKPKGVMIEHRNVTRLFTATDHWFRFNERDVWTLFHSFAFDFSVWELWGALFYGGRVVVVPYLTARSPLEFYRLLCSEKVTVLNQTPSAFAQLIDTQANEPQPAGGHSLRLVIFGGEALELRTLRPWIDRNGTERPRLVNMYGITETTVHVTYRVLTEDEIRSGRGSPIGKPIPDLQNYLLDHCRRPVPIGVTGELYVGGAGVARGYLKRPSLSAERFIRNPFKADPAARLYKSGDLARWRADGTLEYLGRNDHQVKIRGFRIEAGEIETQLADHAIVKEAAVIAREDQAGHKCLVAYVVPTEWTEEESVLRMEALRAHLKKGLPDYMIPSAFVMLKRFPLTNNGKLDRRALPAPGLEAFVSRQYVTPEGEAEEALAKIWRELLPVERVGRDDNFFELGGHSLLIVQMLEKLRRVGLTAEVRAVFQSPTLAELATALTRTTMMEEGTAPPNRVPAGSGVITPDMLPLIAVEPKHIDRIVSAIPGGAINIQDIYPLAPLQEGILFHHLMGGREQGDIYVLPMVLSVSSRQRLNELITALQGVIDRHDILRTCVLWEQLPQPVQVVCRRVTLPVEEVAFPLDRDRQALIDEWIRPNQQWLDLRHAPLMRLTVTTDPNTGECYARLQLHHIVDDATSLNIVMSEVVAHLEGREAKLPPSVPYRNHVAQALQYAAEHNADAFFRAKLGDIEEASTPFGLLNVYGHGAQIAEARIAMDPELASKVRNVARRMGVSTATVFHAAWGLVTAHTTGRDDVVFGSVLLGRLQGSTGTQRILGMFINTLPLRLRLKDLSARSLIEHTQRELVDLLGHEQASLAVAQRCSGIAGSAPLFTGLLNFRHYAHDPEADWNSAPGIRLLAVQERTNYPITLSVDDLGEGFSTTAQTDVRIDPNRVLGYLHTALRSLVIALEQSPQSAAIGLNILPEAEREQLTRAFNATQTSYPRQMVIYQLFEEQVRRTPESIAVVFEEQLVTYAELDRRASQLARALREHGVGPDQLVGVCIERGVEMVVALLGTLKSGGAYVPLDPGFPPDRIASMLKAARPRVLLTQEDLVSKLTPAGADVLALDTRRWQSPQREYSEVAPASTVPGPGNLAYVIFTSGSTGEPKGVMVTQGAVVNFLLSMQKRPGIKASDRLLAVTTISFDIAGLELYLPLISGARVVIASRRVATDAQQLAQTLELEDITLLQATPATWQLLLGIGWTGRPGLKALCGGEALTAELSQKLRSRVGELWNLYGPTETTIWSCARQIVGPPAQDEVVESIGAPIDNTQVYILDSQQQPVPLGVMGEIYIGGDGVANGYLNQPDLTADRFVRDPFGTTSHAGMYRTGDLGRWRADGTIECLGRNDHQVKLHGYRIELGEIEARLVQLDAVQEAAVVVREDVPGEKRLVAYITQFPGVETNAAQLRDELAAVLPEYMVPSAFVELESLPLTPNGKLNRRALPAPELDAYRVRRYEAPQGGVEETLAGIWQSLLGVHQVGRNDNFFELGGHSLLGIKLMARISEDLSAQLSVTTIFRHPTLEQMATAIKTQREIAESSQEVASIEMEEGVF